MAVASGAAAAAAGGGPAAAGTVVAEYLYTLSASSGTPSEITASDFMKGVGLSLMASVVGGASKLAIRKSWILQHRIEQQEEEEAEQEQQQDPTTPSANLAFVVVEIEQGRPAVDAIRADDDVTTSSASGHGVVQQQQQQQHVQPYQHPQHYSSMNTTSTTNNNDNSSRSRGDSWIRAGRTASTVSASVRSSSPDNSRTSERQRQRPQRSQQQQQPFSQATTTTAAAATATRAEDDASTHSLSSSSSSSSSSTSSSIHSADPLRPVIPTAGDGDGRATRNTATTRRRRRCGCCKTTSTSTELRWAYALRFGGMVGMTFLNPLCCVLALNYASPSVLAPFSGLTLVWIVLFSRTLIQETPTPKQVAAASMIVAGEVFVAVFGDHTNDGGVTVEDVKQSYGDPLFVSYFVGITVWMALLWYWMTVPGGAANRSTLKRFSWGVAGGSITGLQNFLKDSLTILKAPNTGSGNPGWAFPWCFFLFLVLAIVTAFGGLLFLTACMKRYDATYSSAMFVGSFVVSASIMSAVHYNTFQHLDAAIDYIMYPVGLLILMGGVYLLIQETSNDNDDDDDEFVEIHRGSMTSTSASLEQSLVPLQPQNDARLPLVSDHDRDEENLSSRGFT